MLSPSERVEPAMESQPLRVESVDDRIAVIGLFVPFPGRRLEPRKILGDAVGRSRCRHGDTGFPLEPC